MQGIAPYNGSFKTFLSRFDIEVMEINLDSSNFHQQPNLIVALPALNTCATQTPTSFDLRGSPYSFSKENVLVMEGCSGSAVLVDQNNKIMAGCSTLCSNNNTIPADSCYGVGCCQTSVPFDGPIYFSVYHVDFNVQSSSSEAQNCLVRALMKSDSVDQYIGKLSTSDPSSSVPVILTWGWISTLQPDDTRANCVRQETSLICVCETGYYGKNLYVRDGCQVPEECKGCQGYCLQNQGSMSYFCDAKSRLPVILGTAFGGGTGIVLLVICGYWLHNFIKKRRKTEQRVRTFKKMLQKHQSPNERGVVEGTTVFSHKELDKATNHFNENRILGQGGQGTVYKGMLTDGRIVAVKMSKLKDETQMEQFINEVVILSQINHRNIVKLFGCCLETEVPLLVYEFAPNGTLSQHIHDPDEEFTISWTLRLKIAADSAGAITYLHSSSSIPIYHRDIKSSNILLDDKYKAKVSDFGTSKTIMMDQTHMTTLVRGTMGYLDPEYFQSSQCTEKSDVYSFGVVLLELLTGKKPIYRDETTEPTNLATKFLFLMRSSRLFDILDPQIVKDAKEEELMGVAHLAKRCLSKNGRLRPTMKEVAMILEMIIKSPTQMPTDSMEDQEAFLDEEFSNSVMSETGDLEFMTNPLPVVVGSSLYIDVQPLLRDTI